MKTFLREAAITLALALLIFLLLQTVIGNTGIHYSCMEPNIHEGQRIIISKIAYKLHEPQRGDVVVFHAPLAPEEDYIKRIIALPGETVEVKDGLVYINGKALDEPYIMEPPTYTYPAKEIPENEYFVLGDNRNDSNDSHEWGTVPRENIVGKAWLSIWPPSDWGLVLNYSFQE